jgi:hypothetical protein
MERGLPSLLNLERSGLFLKCFVCPLEINVTVGLRAWVLMFLWERKFWSIKGEKFFVICCCFGIIATMVNILRDIFSSAAEKEKERILKSIRKRRITEE